METKEIEPYLELLFFSLYTLILKFIFYVSFANKLLTSFSLIVIKNFGGVPQGMIKILNSCLPKAVEMKKKFKKITGNFIV